MSWRAHSSSKAFGSAIHSDEEVEFALGSAHFGQIKVEVADGIGTELLLFHALGLCAQIGQAADAVALKAAMQSGAGQARNGGLQGVEAVVERQQGVLAKGGGNGLLLLGEGC